MISLVGQSSSRTLPLIQGSQNMSDEVEAAASEEIIPIFDHIDQYLDTAVEYEASDLHLSTSAQPILRRNGRLGPIWSNSAYLTAEDTERLAFQLLGDYEKERLEKVGDVDFAHATKNGRFRASVVKQRKGLELVFRVIVADIRTMEELNLPPALKTILNYPAGLILVTGAVGSGKSTTMAAMIEQINMDKEDHIITLEDPIEFVYKCKKCHITQREIPTHTESFARALRASLREDPDIILVGEMRDLETISLAISASETGHLVFGTLHTGSAARTLDRVLDVFPIDQREQIRIMVSESLRGIISQTLIPKVDGSGRVLAMEILINNSAVGSCIRDGKTFMLGGVMQTGKKLGMQTMDDALREHYEKGTISKEDTLARAIDRGTMRDYLNG